MGLSDSRFVYPRSVIWDVARALNDLQSNVPHPPTLRVVIRELANTFAEHDPHFNVDEFIDRCTIGSR